MDGVIDNLESPEWSPGGWNVTGDIMAVSCIDLSEIATGSEQDIPPVSRIRPRVTPGAFSCANRGNRGPCLPSRAQHRAVPASCPARRRGDRQLPIHGAGPDSFSASTQDAGIRRPARTMRARPSGSRCTVQPGTICPSKPTGLRWRHSPTCRANRPSYIRQQRTHRASRPMTGIKLAQGVTVTERYWHDAPTAGTRVLPTLSA